jgi:hypothetical protein
MATAGWVGAEVPPARPREQATPRPAAAEIDTPAPRPSPHAIQPQARPPAPAPGFDVVDEGPGYEIVDMEDDGAPNAVAGEPRPIGAQDWTPGPRPAPSGGYGGGPGDHEHDERDDAPGMLSRYYAPKRTRIGTRSAWRLVSIGLLIAGIGAATGIGVYVLGLLAGILRLGVNPRDPRSFTQGAGGMAVLGVAIILLLVVTILGLIAGFSLGIAAPGKHGSKGLAIATLSLLCGSMVFMCAGAVGAGTAGFVMGALLWLGFYITSAFFLRAVAACMHDHALIESCTELVKLILGVLGGIIVVAIVGGSLAAVAHAKPETAFRFGQILGIIGNLAFTAVWARYVTLIFAARAAVENKL